MRRRGIVVLGLFLLGLVAACSLFFNQPPIARITASVLSGASPLVVSFDGGDSSDTDGTIVSYKWDFGDGETGTGEAVQHTFIALTATTIYTVTLMVVDDAGTRSETTQSIEVLVDADGGDGGIELPVARITADRLIGLTPLVVTFNAADSTPGSGSIVKYDWDFGDGGQAVGPSVSHTFDPTQTEEYRVTLMVWNSNGRVDSEEIDIIAIVPEGETGDEKPVAEVDTSDPNQIYQSDDLPIIPSLFEVTFDPRGSYADAGHQIEYYVWEFGDGEYEIETSDLQVTHIYELRAFLRTFVARLTVYDDQGLEDTVAINVTLIQQEDGE